MGVPVGFVGQFLIEQIYLKQNHKINFQLKIILI
jgi:hypothetical protein